MWDAVSAVYAAPATTDPPPPGLPAAPVEADATFDGAGRRSTAATANQSFTHSDLASYSY